MSKFPRCLMAAAFAVGMVGLSVQAAEKELIPYSSAMMATATSENSSTRTAVKAINGAGLNAAGQHSTSADDSWLAKNSGLPSGGIWYRVDLGDTYNLCSIKVWNYNYKADRGAKETDIYYSTAENPEGSTSPSSDWTLLRTVEMEKATGAADYTGMDPIDFYPVKARYVLFHIKSVWGSYGGLSEVQFFSMSPFGDCSLTKVKDGEFELVGSVEGVDASDVKLVFSADGQEDVEIDLGQQTAGGAFERTVTVSDGLLTTCLYRAKIVSTSVAGVNEFEFSDSFFFGAMPKVFDFMKKIDFTLSATAQAELGESVVADVPVAIRVSTDIQGFDYADMNASGTDVIFGSVDGGEITRYPFEVEAWNPAGESVFWVKVPSLSAATTISMCYGNNVFVPDNTPADVWSDYAVVFHGGTFAEATEKGVAGSAGSDKVTATSSSGWLGGGFNKSTCNSIGLNFTNPVNAGALSSINQMTVSGWYRPTLFKGESTTVGSGVLAANRKNWSNDGNGFLLLIEAGKYESFSIGGAHNPSSDPKASGFSWAKDDWSHFAASYDNVAYATYCNGILLKSGTTSKTIDARTANSWTFGGYAMTAASDNFCGDMDELRVYNGAASADYLKAEYLAMLPNTLAAGPAEPIDETAPIFETPVVSVSADGTVTVSITVTSGEGDVYLMVDGEKVEPKLGTIGTDITIGTPFVAHPTIAANDSAFVAVYGINAKCTEIVKSANGGVMNAAVVVTVVKNAQEVGLGKGQLTIARAEGAANDMDIVVNLAWSGTGEHPAVADKNYVNDLPESVTIPAGEDSVSVEVTPLVDRDSTTDTELTLTIAGGAYISGATAAMTILHLVAPAEYNTWIAAADGLASDASNWSQGVPQSSHKILFDSQYSNANCEWDGGVNGLSTTVAEWMQAEGFTGTVTIDTEFPAYAGASFTCLTVTGDVNLQGGTWTHPVSIYQTSGNPYTLEQMRANAHYRMNVDVKGDFSIASGVKLSADSKGYWRYATGFNIYGSHGGYRNSSTMEPYGDVKHPVDIGSCTCAGTDNKGKAAAGGGAVHLVVGGTLTVDGVISADGNNNGAGGASAGSVYVEANAVTGSGSIHANGVKPTSDKEAGAGGRVAVIATTSVSDTVQLAATAGGAYYSGAGTVYVKTADDNNGRLYIANTLNTQVGYNCRTPITDGDWTFDAIYVDQCAKLYVGEGKTLTLPNGLASVHGGTGSAAYNGILLAGGMLAAGDGDQTMSGKWTFESTKPYTFPGNLTLENGVRLGLFRLLQSGTNNVLACDYTVNGDLTIGADSSVDVSQIYHSSGVNGTLPPSLHGGWSAYDNPSKNYPCASNTYDSVFHPHLPGMTPSKSYYGSGVLKLQVAGVLTVDGTIGSYGSVSDSTSDNTPAAPGGSIDIVAGSLSGSGKIDASGAAGRYVYAGGGGGGRVAIRLTGADAAFTGAPLIRAQGQYGYAFSAKSVKFSSAGTVYLQTAADGERNGEVIVSNFDHPFADFTDFIASGRRWPTTPIVAYGPGADAVADFKNANLVVTNNAIAEVSVAALKMRNLAVAANSKLDLFGNTLTVQSAKLGDTKLAAGTYTESDYSDYLTDSVGGGSLVVKPAGLQLLLR